MGILIGMDEAGYGPNFGPLVVAATAWKLADEGSAFGVQESMPRAKRSAHPVASGASPNLSPRRPAPSLFPLPPSAHHTPPSTLRTPPSYDDFPDLYRLLRGTVVKQPSTCRIAIADSKALYAPGFGLRQLERGLHAVLLAMQQSLDCWNAIIDYCQADADGEHKKACWPEAFNCLLPLDAALDELQRLAKRFATACTNLGIRPLLVRARLVYPAQFNDLISHYGSKGAALSHITVGLLREVIDAIPSFTEEPSPSGKGPGEGALPRAPRTSQPAPLYAVCDKHGGRNFYTALLQHHFSEHWIDIVHESRAESRYEWGPPEGRTHIAFRMNGERFLPTALASMTAKYLRELAMRAFNEFWAAHVPDLRPTAGYPKDSHRFRRDIHAAQRKLKIDDHLIWRNK